MLANPAEHYGHPGVGETVRPEVPSCPASGEHPLRLGDGHPLDGPGRRLLPRPLGPCARTHRQPLLYAVACRPLLDAGGRRHLSVDHGLARVAPRCAVAGGPARRVWTLPRWRWPLLSGWRRRPRLAAALWRGVPPPCPAPSPRPGGF